MFSPYIRKYYDWADAGSDALKGAGTGATIGSIIPGVGTAVGAVAGGLIGGLTGLFQKKKGNQILKQNPYPTESLPPELDTNQRLAQQAATEGMPSEQYQAAERDIQRNQAASLQAATDRRSGVQSAGAIVQASNDATGNLNAKSAEMRRQNLDRLLGANKDIASYRDRLFDWNQKNKYLQNYQYGQSLVGAGNAGMFSGADKILSGLTQGYANGLFSGRSGGSTVQDTTGYQFGGGDQLASIGSGPQSGANTDVILNPNGYSNILLNQ